MSSLLYIDRRERPLDGFPDPPVPSAVHERAGRRRAVTALRAPRPTFAWWVVGWELRTPRRSRKGASMAPRQHTSWKSKRIAAALVAGAVALLVAACGGSSGGSSSS